MGRLVERQREVSAGDVSVARRVRTGRGRKDTRSSADTEAVSRAGTWRSAAVELETV